MNGQLSPVVIVVMISRFRYTAVIVSALSAHREDSAELGAGWIGLRKMLMFH